MIDIPTLTEDQLKLAKDELDKNHSDCPNELQGGRTHDTYFVARLTGQMNYHYCQDCRKGFEERVK
jgi:hypothetical protein